MIANTVLFPIFSIACSFTHDLGSMIVMRGLQGFAGGILIPMAFTMVLTKLPEPQQPIGLALFALSVTFAPAIGPTIGGYLTENCGWQTIFFINAAPNAVMVVMLALTLEREPMRLSLLKEGDWAGIITMASRHDWRGSASGMRRSSCSRKPVGASLPVCATRSKLRHGWRAGNRPGAWQSYDGHPDPLSTPA
jgi:MFS family permease